MRISDWSSDVCSSDLTFGCSRRTDRGDGLADSGWSDDLTDYHHFAARCGAGGPNRSRSSDPRSPAELLGRSESHDRADRPRPFLERLRFPDSQPARSGPRSAADTIEVTKSVVEG